MQKISKLALNQVAKKELSQRQLGKIKAGKGCTCGCCYVNSGGSNSAINGTANCRGEFHTYCPMNEVAVWGC